MLVYKQFKLKRVFAFAGYHMVWLTAWVSVVAFSYQKFELSWLSIPWVPIALIGTAVAFYVGFKNNSAYDRTWEARKIWGAIVNDSRAWGSMVKAYIDDYSLDKNKDSQNIADVKKSLIYRHIAWLYCLRNQLLKPTDWEHERQGGFVKFKARQFRKKYGLGLFEDEIKDAELYHLLSNDEYQKLKHYKNPATHLIDQQAQELAQLTKTGTLETFRQIELQKLLNSFYEQQGKCERIKKFPLPRQYGNISQYLVSIFIFLLPFGMMSEFNGLTGGAFYWSIPLTVLVGWVFVVMETVGDYTENPFEGMGNDIPMLSLCRTIENDLRQMLNETELPEDIKIKNGVLM
ncbi:bestrophin family protein [Roseivirga pacifica]|uniref:bestrophin family protein n=1 Tax=Roseivirga pacifica TaxID=1267423 RepID=UPI00227C12B4|nr:bestrophin family ion channel [Roseivirga pacifica]